LLGPRSWPTSYRGLLAIHAAKAFPGWACELCLTSPFFEALTEGRGAVQALRLPLGKVVAVAELVDVGRSPAPSRSATYSAPTRSHWRLHARRVRLGPGQRPAAVRADPGARRAEPLVVGCTG
jgi:hypothetical protein